MTLKTMTDDAHQKPVKPVKSTPQQQRWCPPMIEDRVLAHSVYSAPDREESVLGCYYVAPEVLR